MFGQLLLPALPNGKASGRSVRLALGWLSIQDGVIAEIGEGDPPRTPDVGDEDTFISPGFVDTHLHIPQFDSIGVTGLELLDWLDRVIFPAEARWADADYAGQMATRVAQELLSFGTTAVAAYGTVHHEGTKAAMAAMAGAGIRGVVGQVLMDRNAPPELVRPAKQLIEEARRLAPHGSVRPAVTPRFAITCSDELLLAAGSIAKATGWFVQTHLAETRRELETIAEIYGGVPYTEVYRRAGLLTESCLLGHGIWLDEADHASIREAGATVAHCPTANRFLKAGTLDRGRALARGVRVSLGSDVAGGPDRSMVRVARAMAEAATSLGGPEISAGECWWQITAGNAAALGLGVRGVAVGEAPIGTLQKGFAADLVVASPTIRWRASVDPLSALMYGWDDRWIRQARTDGIVRWTR